MTFISFVLLGIVQGILEFMPVSSFGNLTIIEHIFGIQTDTGLLLEVFLHVGTLIAIFYGFGGEILELLMESIQVFKDLIHNLKVAGRNLFAHENIAYRRIIDNTKRKYLLHIFLSSIPLVVISSQARGLVLLSEKNMAITALCFFVTGLFLLVTDKLPVGEKQTRQMTAADAIWIGIAQSLAVFPGISRAGFVICIGLLCGLEKKYVIKYSYLLAIPGMLGAFFSEMTKISSISVSGGYIGYCILASIVAAGTGIFVIRRMLLIIYKKRLSIFAYYCMAAGVVSVLVMYFI